MKILMLSILLCSASMAMSQSQVVTTGNNVIDGSNPYGADIVIGSDAAGGIRHDGSIMLWSSSSASRISSTGNTFSFSAWSTPQVPNVSFATDRGGTSFVMGNFGIGTTNPSDRLVVNGNIRAILDQANFPNKNVAGIVAIGYSGITGAQNWALRGVYQHGFGVGNNADGGDLDVIKSLNGSTILATKTDGTPLGNVGIGITNPTERLAVNGMIRSKEVKVEATNWPDYVFEEGYKVETLEGLESYIKANKHLPGMPSAKEVENNGLELGGVIKQLLKNQEELTLHLIEIEKENQQLKKAYFQMKQKINLIKTKK